jgi:ribosomal protein S18 acetylase RimI-like enzyme
MIIREMTEDDYDSVYALWAKTANMGLRDIDDSKNAIAKFLQSNPGCSFAAEEDDRIIGAILGGSDGRRGFIYHAAVDIERRGRGIGALLLESVKRSFEKQGITRISLHVYNTNETGNAFWKTSGFTRRDDVYYYSYDLSKDSPDCGR